MGTIFEEFDDNVEIDPERQRMLETATALLTRVKNNDHTKFEFIRNLDEYSCAKVFKDAVTHVANEFERVGKECFRDYLKSVKAGAHLPIDTLLTFGELNRASKFYRDEANIAKDMLNEYQAYLNAGHTIDAFLGGYRDIQDLKDFRKQRDE